MKVLVLVLLVLAGACEMPVAQAPAPAGAPAPAVAPLVRKTVAAEDPSDRRVAVLLHGYGSNEDDLVPLGRRLGFKGELVALRAPETAGRGYAWFPINFEPGGTRYEPNAADDSLKRLAAELAELRQEGRKVVVVGFSQGAMLAMMLAVEHADVVDAAVAFSGALPRPVVGRGPSAPIFAAHGDADNVVTVDRARQAQELLAAAGARAEYHEYPGLRHRISPEGVRDAIAFLSGP